MILRQDCARILSNPGANKLLNLKGCARMRQDRQGLTTYRIRARKIQNLFLSLDSNKSNNPGDPGASSVYTALLCFNPGATLAQREGLMAEDAFARFRRLRSIAQSAVISVLSAIKG